MGCRWENGVEWLRLGGKGMKGKEGLICGRGSEAISVTMYLRINRWYYAMVAI